MNKPLISIIVPVYNTEKYLDKCITSIVHQTYKEIEIILVDDGSPDASAQICDEWAAKDERIKVIHKSNGGLSSARNAGLDCCRGEYIGFVDSDDWIENNMYETLYNACRKENVLLGVCGRFDDYENRSSIGRCPNRQEIVDTETALKNVFIGEGYDSSAWDKLYHRSLWKDMRFPDGMIYEDIAILYKIIIRAEKIVTCNAPLYHYNHRPNSILTSSFSTAIFDYPFHTSGIVSEIDTKYPQIKEYAVWAHLAAICRVLRKIASSSSENYNSQKKNYSKYALDLKTYRYIWKSSSLFSRKTKLRYMVLSIRWLARILLR